MNIYHTLFNIRGFVWDYAALYKIIFMHNLAVIILILHINILPFKKKCMKICCIKCLHLLSDTYPPLVFPTMHMLVEAVNLHVISSSWDLQFLSCLSESTRSKSAVLNINANMKEGGMRNIMCNGTKATKTGKLFYDTIKVSYLD